MGTTYQVACRDCKVARDLDKFYAMRSAKTREEALDVAAQIVETDNFRAALLVTFMWDHRGHNCTVYNEHDYELSEELDPSYGKTREDHDFWKE